MLLDAAAGVVMSKQKIPNPMNSTTTGYHNGETWVTPQDDDPENPGNELGDRVAPPFLMNDAAAQGPASDGKDAATHNTFGESDTQTRSADTADKDNSERQAVAIDVSPTAPQGGGKTDAAAPNRRRRYCLIGAVLILVAAIAVVVGVFASGSNNTSKTPSPTSHPGKPITPTRTPAVVWNTGWGACVYVSRQRASFALLTSTNRSLALRRLALTCSSFPSTRTERHHYTTTTTPHSLSIANAT
jgi:hypothetical protein